jgi:hypothetical protein
VGGARQQAAFIALSSAFIAAAGLAGAGLSAQATARTPDGLPDLQGMWLNDTATPLERTKEFADKAVFTDAEARDYERHYQLDRTMALSRGDPAFEIVVAGDLDTYEPGHVLPGMRTSMITDPADGRIPALRPEAARVFSERTAHMTAHYAENPEDFPNAERCLMIGNTAGPPMLPVFYNNNVRIVQTHDYVMIESEMIHDARLIPLNRTTHLPSAIRQWKGDSIGRWEGDTLVVDTTNFSDETTVRGSGSALHVVERFTLRSAGVLAYQFTIDDPVAFSRPWSAESVMSKTSDRMFEYACHEANYSLVNVMKGSRLGEQRSAAHN